jgi:hypothetical protein
MVHEDWINRSHTGPTVQPESGHTNRRPNPSEDWLNHDPGGSSAMVGACEYSWFTMGDFPPPTSR